VSGLRPEVRALVFSAVRATPSASRREVGRRNAARLGFAALLALAEFFALGGSVYGARSVGLTLLSAAGWGLVALAITRLSLVRGPSMLGRPTRALFTMAVTCAPIVFCWAAATAGTQGARADWGLHARCLGAAALLSAPPFVAFLYARRHSDPVHPAALGAALGAASGAWGGALIDLHCPVTHMAHLGAAHVMPIALFALAGAAIGKRVLAQR